MDNLLRRLVGSLLDRRWFVIVFVALIFISAASLYAKNQHNSDNSLPVWLDHGDLDYVNYQNYLKEFENDRFLAIAFEVPDAFGVDELSFIKRLSARLQELPQVEKVQSLTTVQHTESRGDELVIEGLFENLPMGPDEIVRRKAIALSDEMMNGLLVDADSTVTALLLTLNVDTSVPTSNQLIKDVRAVVQEQNTQNYILHMTGPPVTDSAFERLSHEDQQVFLPVIHLTIFLVTFLFFRNFFIAFIPIIIQMLIVIITMGVYFLFGNSINVVTAMMGPVLVAVCVADCVHMMLGYYEFRGHGLPQRMAIIEAARQTYVPCFFTALTTFAGFIAFNASPIVPNRVLGMYIAFGVMLAYVFTILFIPIILSFLPERHRQVAVIVDDSFVQRCLVHTNRLVIGHPGMVGFVFAAALILAIFGMTRIRIETNTIEYFPKHEQVRQDVDFFEKRLSGAGSFELVLDSQDAKIEIAKDPRLLKMIEAFRVEALKKPFTNKVISYTEYIKKLNRAFHDNDPAFYRIPDTKDEIAQLLLVAESSGDREINDFKSLNNSKIHIAIRSDWKSSELMNTYIKDFKRMAEAYFRPMGVSVLMTGVGALWIKVDDNILVSEYYSFFSALIMVVFMMIAVLRSVNGGIISMIPNVVPIFLAMGFMGFLNIDLNVSTVMTAGIAMGITVDDSIHYLVRFKNVLRRVGNYEDAIAETNKTIGTAVVFTTTVLVFGFGVLMLSNFSPSRYFGAVTALTLFLSIFCEIFLMPLLLLWLKPFPINR